MKTPMRSEGQKQVMVMMRQEFLDEIDKAFPLAGFSDRSSFIRDAVYRAIGELGINLPMVIKTAPSRKGKGGTPSHKMPWRRSRK